MGHTAVIIYGNGDHLGRFEVFAGSLANTLRPIYGHDRVLIQKILRRDEFFSYIAGPPTLAPTDKIAEVHVFAHSIGGGLFIAYGDTTIDHRREYVAQRAKNAGRRVTYQEALDTETGAVLTDDFIRSPYRERREAVRRNLTEHATIKLWGCNAGVKGWVYSDGWGVTDPADMETTYYWRALNEQHVPKPAVAQAVADYFGRTCWCAGSGSHVEVLNQGHWESTAHYRSSTGRWPSGAMIHRLHPDRGDYRAYHPAR